MLMPSERGNLEGMSNTLENLSNNEDRVVGSSGWSRLVVLTAVI